jgi:hypothetical protein
MHNNAIVFVSAQLVGVKRVHDEILRLTISANVDAGIFCYSSESENGLCKPKPWTIFDLTRLVPQMR